VPSYDLTIRLPERGKIIQFGAFLDFCRRLEVAEPGSNVLLDLQRVEFAHCTGMAPIVAVIDHLIHQGWQFDVALPQSDFLADYFDKAGWEAGILGEHSAPSIIPGATFIPLTKYETSEELNPVLTEAIHHFAKHAIFESGVLEGMEWAVNEVADNVLNHAGGVPGWLQLAEHPKKGMIEIVVVDCGIGICASMRERFPNLKSDVEAIELAAAKGVTRDEAVGQGNGLAGTLRIAVAGEGWVNLHSGRGLLQYIPDERPDMAVPKTTDHGKTPMGAAINISVRHGPYHAGTAVTLTLPTHHKLDVSAALWGNRPMSVFESQYLSDDGSEIRFRLAEEASGFGNRASARPLRQQMHNLLNLYPTQRMIIDFTSVNVASASFLDELIARLAKEAGVATFFQRIALVNMNDFVRRTLDAVMEQRLGRL